MKKKNFLPMVLVAVLMIFTGMQAVLATGAQESTGPAEITIAIEATGDIPQEFQKQIDRFNTSQDGIVASILTYSGADAYETAIMGQIAGKRAPDVIWIDGGLKIWDYAENGVITPLDSYLANDLKRFEPSLLSAFTYQGKVYGIPKDYNTSVLFYQKDALNAAGIGVPKTIDEFIAAAKKLTTADVFGFGCDPKINYLYPFMATTGADFIGQDGTIDKTKLKSDDHKQTLAMLKGLFDNGYATSPYLSNAGWDGELVGNGKVAMLYGGSWITGVISDTSKTGVAPLPKANDGYSMLYTAGWAISEQSKNEEAAAALISFISSDKEMVDGNMLGLVGLPPTSSAMEKLIAAKNDDPFLPVYNEVVKGGVPFGLIPSKFVDGYNKALENMLYNGASVDATIAAMTASVE